MLRAAENRFQGFLERGEFDRVSRLDTGAIERDILGRGQPVSASAWVTGRKSDGSYPRNAASRRPISSRDIRSGPPT